MSLALDKVWVLAQFKSKELFKNKTFLISFIMAPGMAFIMKIAYSQMVDGELPIQLLGLVLQMGVLFSICMIAIMMPGTFIAKDKENNTLRSLMTSSVNIGEYIVGTLLPIVCITMFSNILVVFVSGLSLSKVNLPVYIGVTLLATLSATIVGLLIGLATNNQMGASNLSSVVMMVLLFIPMFSSMMPQLEKVSEFLFTGVVSNMVMDFAKGKSNPVTTIDWLVLVGSFIILLVVFVIMFKKKGFVDE